MRSGIDITRLLKDLSDGRPECAAILLEAVYGELYRLARRYMRRERRDHTLQATALVNEAYLRLVDKREMNWQNRAHFFAVSAQVMRRILVDYARMHCAQKRDGNLDRVSLDEALPVALARSHELLALDEALGRLAELSERQSRIVEMRYFAGLTVEETAEVMQIAPRTVKRDWNLARAWLYREIRGRS